MNPINQVILEGNLVRDPEFRETPKGTKVSVFSIAVNRFYKDSNGEKTSEVSYYNIEAWGEKFSADIAKAGEKGRGVKIIGRLKQDRWKDSQDKWNSKIYIVAEHIDFKASSKNNSESANTEGNFSEEDNLAQAADGIMKEAASF